MTPAVSTLNLSPAAELAPRLIVNARALSLTDTPIEKALLNQRQMRDAAAQRDPLKRIGSPQVVAEAAAFLLPDRSSWMTKQILRVDGGLSGVRPI